MLANIHFNLHVHPQKLKKERSEKCNQHNEFSSQIKLINTGKPVHFLTIKHEGK